MNIAVALKAVLIPSPGEKSIDFIAIDAGQLIIRLCLLSLTGIFGPTMTGSPSISKESTFEAVAVI